MRDESSVTGHHGSCSSAAFAIAVLCATLITSCGTATESSPMQLTVPAIDGLPVREGFFTGADGVRLFYRLAGMGSDPIVFLHGGPGLGIDDGGYDLEPLAA